MLLLDPFLTALRDSQAESLHLAAGERPVWRVGGSLIPNGDPLPPPGDFDAMLMDLVAVAGLTEQYRENADLEFTHDGPGCRVRVFIGRDARGRTVVLRRAAAQPVLDELDLPRELAGTVDDPRGLVLVSGATDAGRTEVLAGLVGAINERHQRYIFVFDGTTEYVYPAAASMLHQLRVGTDVADFAEGIDTATRAGADVVAVGSIGDTATACAVMSALDAGALVFATVAAHSVTDALGRVLYLLPRETHSFERSCFADYLRVAAHLQVITSRHGEPTRVVELAESTSELRTLIREDRVAELGARFAESNAKGLRCLETALVERVRAGELTREDAFRYARSRTRLERDLGL